MTNTTNTWTVVGQSRTSESFLVCDDSRMVRIMHLNPPIIWPQSEDGNDEFSQTWYAPDIDLGDAFNDATVVDSYDGLEVFNALKDIEVQ